MAQKTTTATAVEEKKKRRFLVHKNHRRKFATLFDHGPCPDHCK